MAQVLNVLFSSKVILACLVAFSSSWVSARSISDLDAVNQSAWQRTLSMRVAKAHTQMAAAVDVQDAEIELHRSIAEFEHILSQLEVNSPNSKIHLRVDTLKKEWREFRSLAESTPTKENVVLVIEDANDVMFQADALMREWKVRLPGVHGSSIDLATQQSMLSERIGAFYAAQYLGVDQPWMAQELKHSIEAYEQGMVALRESEQRGQVNVALMAQLNSNWEYAKLGLSQFQKGQFVPVVIAVTMESMYQQTNTLGAAYHVQERIALNSGVGSAGLAANIPD